ncbi:MAG: cytochrome c oxidase assembly protein [Gaiellaceae bacterium]
MIASPLSIGVAGVCSVLFVRGFRRLRRRRPGYAGWGRAALFVPAVAAGLVALSAPLDDLAEESLSAHMLQHVLLADVVPALGLVALRGPLLFFVVPEFLLRAVSDNARARGVLSTVTRPLVALGVWAGTLALWHVPVAYEATLTSEPLHVFEHASFVVAGSLAWIQIVDPARRRALGTVGRLGFVLAMFVVGQMFATTLVLSQSPVYDAYSGEAGRLFGMSALEDQDTAGFVMMIEQMLVLGVAAVFLVRRHLAESSDAAAVGESPGHPLAA